MSEGELNVNPTYFILEKQNLDIDYVITEPEACSVTVNEVNVYNKAAFNALEDDSYDKIGQKRAVIQDKKNTYSSLANGAKHRMMLLKIHQIIVPHITILNIRLAIRLNNSK